MAIDPLIANIHSTAHLLSFLIEKQLSFPLILLTGGFNFPDIVWFDGHSHIKPSPAYGYEINDSFLDLADDNNLEQVVHEPTRNKNILFLVYLSCIYFMCFYNSWNLRS